MARGGRAALISVMARRQKVVIKLVIVDAAETGRVPRHRGVAAQSVLMGQGALGGRQLTT